MNKEKLESILEDMLSTGGDFAEIFIEDKISLHDRDLWPIVTDSVGNIVWIPGLKKSKFDKSKQENYDIIMKYC